MRRRSSRTRLRERKGDNAGAGKGLFAELCGSGPAAVLVSVPLRLCGWVRIAVHPRCKRIQRISDSSSPILHSEEPRKRNEKGKREHVQGYYKRLAVIEPPVSQRGSATFGRIPERPQLELQHADSGFKHGSTFVESSTTLNTDIFDLFEPQPLLTVSL